MQDHLTERAAAIGREHGQAAASWVFNGNTTAATYRTVLRGFEDGDPAILDSYRTPNLSGEYADDYSEGDLLADLDLPASWQVCPLPEFEREELISEIADAYNDAASETFWQAIETTCREHIEHEIIDALKSAGYPVTWLDDDAVMDAGYALPYSHYRHNGPTSHARAYVDLSKVAKGEDTADQSSTVDRSNYRSLMRDYPDVWLPIGYSNVNALGAYVANLSPELTEILTGLVEQYPVYDESDMCELESDEITESWAQYVQADLTSEIHRAHCDEGDAWDALSEDAQREIFWTTVESTDSYPEHNGHDVLWRYDAIITELAVKLGVHANLSEREL